MSGQKSEQNSYPSLNTATTTTASLNTTHTRQRILDNIVLIWLDANIDPLNEECQNTLSQLRNVVDNVNIFTDRNECVDLLTEIEDRKAFLVVSGTLSRQIIPLIHDIPQLHTIYIFGHNKSQHQQWSQEWIKIKGVHTDVEAICESLQHAKKQSNQNSMTVSFVAMDEDVSSPNLNQLEPSFMYTQIFKEILLEMKYNQQSIQDFTTYCRNSDYGSLTNITRFEKEYNAQLAIWWYTYPSFIFRLLNSALRLLEANTIINMGFFIHDLHHQIEELYKKQINSYHGKPFIVYRGQGLSSTDFEKLQTTKGGLMSFNNFLSTSKKREVPHGFAVGGLGETDMVGILFEMNIDPLVSSTPFAAIDEVSYYKTEEEILFSMHTVFRIGEVTKMDNDNPLYRVELKLTTDDDEQLRTLTERIRVETPGETEWERLGQLLLKLNQCDKAEELYKALLEQVSGDGKKALYYNCLGRVKNSQGDYEKAIGYFEQMLSICQKDLPPNHASLASLYNNIGAVYKNMGENSKAFSFYQKALEIQQKTLPPNHLDLATSYGNIALVYRNMGEYSKALSFYQKALEIRQKTLPSNHPDLATSYNNIGAVYYNTGEYSKALSFYQKAAEIEQKTLPPNHPDLATSYNNIGLVYLSMGEHSKALSFYQKAVEIRQKTLPPNHPYLATSYNNIGAVYYNTGEYSKALSFYRKALEIQQKTFPPNHPDLATSYNNIGLVYYNTGEYSKALSFYQKAFEIEQKNIPPNHPALAISYNNIGLVYCNMGEYSKALSFYQKALENRQKTLPLNHPSLATSYNNIGVVYYHMGQYSKALSFYEKSLEIQQKTFPPNHPDLATSYNNIAEVYKNMGEYSKALSYLERALNIFKNSLPENHPNIKIVQENIELLKQNL
jgi:tetratricopeptide (TPR) repeat protein